MSRECSYTAPLSEWLLHLRSLVAELEAMDDGEKAAMVDSMKRAADELLSGMCKATLESLAGREASEAVAKAAASARSARQRDY